MYIARCVADKDKEGRHNDVVLPHKIINKKKKKKKRKKERSVRV